MVSWRILLISAALGAQGNRVCDHQFIELGGPNIFQGVARQHRVGTVGDHLGGAVFLEGVGGFTQGAGGIDHVVHQQAGAALDFTDQVHHLGFAGARAAFVDDGQVGLVQLLGDGPRLTTPPISGDTTIRLSYSAGQDIVIQHRRAVDVVHRAGEEALDLLRVQVHRQYPVHPTVTIMSATTLAEMGTRAERTRRSWRA